MKTQEELIALKEEVEILNKKLAELTKDELEQVTGGFSAKSYSFSKGDKFSSGTSTYYVLKDYVEISSGGNIKTVGNITKDYIAEIGVTASILASYMYLGVDLGGLEDYLSKLK